MSISLRPTDAAEVVTTTAEGFRPAAAKSGLAIVVRVPGADEPGTPVGAAAPLSPGLPVAADPDRLAQLLANLLENALTFARTTRDRDDGRTTCVAGACVITVDDDGPGIAPGDLTRVFERFYRADRGPNRQIGSGLGLAIVAELATAMGGTVRAESPVTSDGGSRFVVTLRYWPAPTGGAPALAPSAPGPAPRTPAAADDLSTSCARNRGRVRFPVDGCPGSNQERAALRATLEEGHQAPRRRA